MKKMLLAGTALLTLVSGSAMAADLSRPGPAPVYTKAPMMAPLFTWTGCYVGGNVGGLFVQKNVTATAAIGGVTTVGSGSLNIDGWAAGGQLGCNYQVSTWVFGIQGDYDWANASGTTALAGLGGGASAAVTVNSVASVTGRVGYAWDRFLAYVKGGGAWELDNYTAGATGFVGTSISDTRSGWTLGGGGEYAFTDWLTGFVEYDYYNFGTKSESLATLVSANVSETKSVVKGGINFKFGGWH